MVKTSSWMAACIRNNFRTISDQSYRNTAAPPKKTRCTRHCSIQPQGLAIEIFEVGFKPLFCEDLRGHATICEGVRDDIQLAMQDSDQGLVQDKGNYLSESDEMYSFNIIYQTKRLYGSTQPKGAQQNAQQPCTVGLRLRFGHATVSVITLFSTIINHLLTNTYKT